MSRLYWGLFSICLLCVQSFVFSSSQASPELAGSKKSEAPHKALPAAPSNTKVYVVRQVNDDVITSVDLDNRLRLFRDVYGMPMLPGSEKAIRAQAIQSMTEELLQYQAAQKYKINPSDEAIRYTIARMEKNQGQPEGSLLAEMARLGIPAGTLTDQIKSNMAWIELVRAKFGETTFVTDYEVQNQIKNVQQTAGRPSYLVQEIFLLAPNRRGDGSPGSPSLEPDMAATKAFADQIIQQLREGADFSVLAQQFSDSPSAMNGGIIGWVREGELDDSRNEVIQSLQPGYLSMPIEANGGLYLIRLLDKKMPEQSMGKVLDFTKITVPLYFVASDEAKAARRQELAERLKSVTSHDQIKTLAEELGAKVDDFTDRAESALSDIDRKRLKNLDFHVASPVYDTQDGFVVYWLQDRTERPMMEGLTSPEEVRETLLNKKLEAAANAYLQQIRRKALIRDEGESGPAAAPAGTESHEPARG